MNWQIVILTFLGIFTLFIICLFWATMELERHKKREAKKWLNWAEKRRGRNEV